MIATEKYHTPPEGDPQPLSATARISSEIASMDV
jgi:hypothetical protein